MLMARWILFLSFVIVLALDGARSYYARIGYARPTELWQPDPAVYADLRWPPGSDVQPGQPLGARVFAQRCAVCHGPDGRGNGPAAPSLIPRPRDFSLGLFKYKSTLRNDPPTDEDLRRVVTDGLPASAMAAFGDLLNEDEIDAVVAEVKRMARLPDAPPTRITVPPPPTDPDSPARGRDLYARLGCAGCHGADGRKTGHLQDAKGYPVPIRDLTAPWTFPGGSDAEDIWMVLTTGLAGSSMPSYADAATASERWDLVHYLQSIARVPPWQPGGRLEGPGQSPDLLKRGEYLVHAQMCGLCHTQINRTGIYRDDRYLAGGMRVGAYPHAQFVSANLTSDATTGLGRRTEEQIMEVFRSGRTPDRVLNLWGMPWFYLHYLNSDDARAIARFLKSQPPIRNEIPPPLRYGVVETVAAKIVSPLPAANPTVITFGAGNFARDARQVQRPARLLIGAQWLALALGAARSSS